MDSLDSDFDSLSDRYEWLNGTNPFHPDSDGDGVDDGRERELGTDPTKHAARTDSDGDGLMDNEDADPGDAAVRWRKTSNPGYVAIALGRPIEVTDSSPPGFAVNEHFGLKDLSEYGKVIAASDPVREALEPWSSLFWYDQPDVAHFVTKVWQPASGEWSGSLTTDPYLPAVGWRFNGLGDLYGEG